MTAPAKVVASSERDVSGESVNRPRILALDLSLTCTGVCLDGALSTLVPPKGCLGVQRLQWIRGQALSRCTDFADDPSVDLVVIEGYAYGAKGSAVINIGELGGVIRVALLDYYVPYVEVNPSNLKQFATGKGNAKKDMMLVAARERRGYTGYDHNEADALFLHAMAVAHYTGTATNETQRKALAKIAWPTIGERSSSETST